MRLRRRNKPVRREPPEDLRIGAVAPTEIVEQRDSVGSSSDADQVPNRFVDSRQRHPIRIDVTI